MGRLGITGTREPIATLNGEALRKALVDSAALARMAKTWPVLVATPGGLVGKRGPGLVPR